MAQKPDDASNLQGSNDVYVRALTTQTGGQTQSNPVADARAKLQAQQSGNTGGSIRRLFGFAGGTSEVQAPSFWDQPPGGRVVAPAAAPVAPAPVNPGFWNAVGQASQKPYYGFPVPSAADVQHVMQPIVDPVAGVIAAARNDFAAGARSVNPNYGVVAASAPTPAPPVTHGPGPQTSTIGSTVGQSVAPQPVMPNPRPPLSPKTHTLQDFVNATRGLTWDQAAQMMQWAPPDMRNPQMQAQQTLADLTRAAADAHITSAKAMQTKDPKGAMALLDKAISYAQGAVGSGVGATGPVLTETMRRGMVAQ